MHLICMVTHKTPPFDKICKLNRKCVLDPLLPIMDFPQEGVVFFIGNINML